MKSTHHGRSKFPSVSSAHFLTGHFHRQSIQCQSNGYGLLSVKVQHVQNLHPVVGSYESESNNSPYGNGNFHVLNNLNKIPPLTVVHHLISQRLNQMVSDVLLPVNLSH